MPILVAGDVFLPHEFDPQAGTWEPRLFIMGIDGSVQIELLNEPESDAEGHVSVITALPDGRMLLGGSFYHYLVQPNNSDLYGSKSRPHLLPATVISAACFSAHWGVC